MDSTNEEEREKIAALNHAMLKVLLVEFLRDTNMPFAVVSNKKFHALLQFLQPGLLVPYVADLLKINIEEMHTFKRWERFGRNDNLAMSESELKIERRKMAEKLSSTMPEEVEEPCEQSCFSDSSPSSSQDLYQYNEVVEIRDPREEMTYDDDVEYIRSISPPRHEIQQIQSTASYLKRPRNENCMSPSPSIHELRQVQSTIPYRRRPRDEIADIVNSSSIRLRNVSGIPEKVKPKPPPQPKAKPIVALPFVAGLSSWLCIVCHQRVPPSQLRAVGANDAYIIIYLSMMKGQYSMEKAKDTARFSQYKCCVNHLTNIYEEALEQFGIKDPLIDVHNANPKFFEAYLAINEFREYCPFKFPTTCQKYAAPFCTSILKFFEKYRRQNYVQRALISDPLEASSSSEKPDGDEPEIVE